MIADERDSWTKGTPTISVSSMENLPADILVSLLADSSINQRDA